MTNEYDKALEALKDLRGEARCYIDMKDQSDIHRRIDMDSIENNVEVIRTALQRAVLTEQPLFSRRRLEERTQGLVKALEEIAESHDSLENDTVAREALATWKGE